MNMPLVPPATAGDPGIGMPLVVGADHEGTTLLRRMLDAHSRIAMAPGTEFPESLFHAAVDLPGGAIADRVVAQPTWPALGIERDAYLAACRGRDGVAALRLVWERHRERRSKPVVGDGSSGYVRFLPAIARVLAGVRVIHLVRDGRDCLAARMAATFTPRDIAALPPATQAAEWCASVAAGRRDGPSLAAYLEVRHEDLVGDPERVLAAICSFLGVRPEPAMIDRLRRAESGLGSTGHPPDETGVGRWRETLLPHTVAEYERVAGPTLAACGYEPAATIMARRDEPASRDLAGRSAAALARFDYGAARRLATLAHRADPTSIERTRELAAVAEWTQDPAVHWRMEVACDGEADARFGRSVPAWNGEPLAAARRLFVWKSQRHLGAEVRYAAALANLGAAAGHCSVEVDPRLMPLLGRQFPSVGFVPRGRAARDAVPPGTAFHATWERLGHFLLPSAAALPTEPWLAADPARVERFAHRRFPRSLWPRVALVWHSINPDKSLPSPRAWRRVLAVRGIEFVSAQQPAEPRGDAWLAAYGHRVRVEPVDLHDDLDGLAAVLRSCDLLVAVSASQAHVAGALGVPTWLVMREEPRLSWPLGSEATIWYPRTRCLWARDPTGWKPVFRRVARELRAWRNARLRAALGLSR